jgi:Zn-dependent protease with chaperone function
MRCNVRTVLLAGKIMSVSAFPVWSLALVALAGLACFFGAVLRVLPPTLRVRYPRVMALLTALFLLPVVAGRDPRGLLWLTGVAGFGMAVTMWWMGPMPADMVPARGAARYRHPQYAAVARRGRIAGLAGLALSAGLCLLSVLFISGV